MSKGTLRITHTAADGTLLEGTSKGDGAWEAIKTAQAAYRIRGWKYFPSIRMIGVSHSRDRAPQLGVIDTTAEVLREAGFEVAIEVDGTPRAMEEAEADRAERMDDRAAALYYKAARRGTEAQAHQEAAARIADGIPMGQPVLVGHHSERRHRRDLQRIETNMRKAIVLDDEARRAQDSAVSAENHMRNRENPRVVTRRIKTLEADRRRVQRDLDGYRRTFRDGRGVVVDVEDHQPAGGRYREDLLARAAELDEKIRYWKKFLDTEITEGRFHPVNLGDIKPGDLIQYWGGWREVVKVNLVTVSVKTDYSWTDKVPADKITGHRSVEPGGSIRDQQG